MDRLENRRILLTGASSGVGLAAVRLLAGEGARLALVTRRPDALSSWLAEQGIAAEVIEADLGELGQGQRAVEEAVEALGGLDAVVSNAAAAVFGHVLEVHPEDFDRTVRVTFTGAVDVVRAALPHLRETRGTVVATGSLMSRVPLPTWSSYTAAKHGLRGFLNTLKVEERSNGSGVRFAMVHPGPIDTPLFAHSASSTGRKPRIPPDAYSPETVAQAIVEMVVKPRDEVVLGGVTRLVDLMFVGARPVAEGLLIFIDRWYRSGDERAQTPGSLHLPPDRLQLSGGIPSRESLWAVAQLGRRMMPSPVTPFRLARHLVSTGVRAVQLSGDLLHPRPERPVPELSLAGAHESEAAPRGSGAVTV